MGVNMAKLLLNQYQKPVRLIIRSWDYVVGYPLIILGVMFLVGFGTGFFGALALFIRGFPHISAK